MKSILKIFFMLLLVMVTLPLFSEEKFLSEDKEIKTVNIDTKDIEGKLKAGVVIGYPWGITAGYRFSNFFELNGLIGCGNSDLATGVNGLFTLFKFNISGEEFPFSVGPTLYTYFGHEKGHNRRGRDDEYTKIDLLGTARLEYSFRNIPLNLFIEAGLGFEIVRFADTAGSFGIGVRYIF